LTAGYWQNKIQEPAVNLGLDLHELCRLTNANSLEPN